MWHNIVRRIWLARIALLIWNVPWASALSITEDELEEEQLESLLSNSITIAYMFFSSPFYVKNYNRLSYSKCTSKVKSVVPSAWVLQQPALYAKRSRITKCANRVFPKSWVDHVEKKRLYYLIIVHESGVCHENEIKNLFFEIPHADCVTCKHTSQRHHYINDLLSTAET